MKKPLNYHGFAFDDISKEYSKDYLKTKDGKKTLKAVKKRQKKHQKQVKERGFDDTECWNLGDSIIAYTLPRLKHFREITMSYPSDFDSIEDWYKVLDAMILSFEIAVNDELILDDKIKAYKKGFKLFGKYLPTLWD